MEKPGISNQKIEILGFPYIEFETLGISSEIPNISEKV